MTSDSKSLKTSSSYICQGARKKFSAYSDQNWRGAEGCNVSTINSSKSVLNSLINYCSAETKYIYCKNIRLLYRTLLDINKGT